MTRRSAAHLVAISGRTDASLLDWTTVEDDLKNWPNQSREEAFLSLVISHLFDIRNPDIRFWRTEGGNDRGIDAIVIDDKEKRAHFVTTKCVKAFEKSARNFPSAEIDKSLTFLDEFIHKTLSLKTCNAVLASAVLELWDCFDQNYHSVHFHICSNQKPLVADEQQRLRLNLVGKKIALEEHHLLTFSNGRTRAIQPNLRKLTFSGGKIERTLRNARTITGYVSVAEVARFLTAPDGTLDPSLFQANIRAFLGDQTEINKDIAKTLYGNERELFECLNNGIKLVCEAALVAAGAQPIHVTNAQVINGLQTANVLFEFAKTRPDQAANAAVLVHITVTTDAKLVTNIALATNSQQRIGSRDLRSNDPLQIKLGRELKRKGFRYLRKQGEISDVPMAQTIDSLRLGQIIVAYKLGQPDKAKISNAIFGDLYDEVFNPKILSADVVISLHSLYRLIESKKILAKAAQRKISREEYSEEWIIEGIFHVLHATRLLCQGGSQNPYAFDEAKLFVDEAIDIISRCFEKADASAYRFFRVVATRTAIEEAISLRLAASGGKPKDKRQLSLFESI